jgi:hypothetical protein
MKPILLAKGSKDDVDRKTIIKEAEPLIQFRYCLVPTLAIL